MDFRRESHVSTNFTEQVFPMRPQPPRAGPLLCSCRVAAACYRWNAPETSRLQMDNESVVRAHTSKITTVIVAVGGRGRAGLRQDLYRAGRVVMD